MPLSDLHLRLTEKSDGSRVYKRDWDAVPSHGDQRKPIPVRVTCNGESKHFGSAREAFVEYGIPERRLSNIMNYLKMCGAVNVEVGEGHSLLFERCTLPFTEEE